MDNVVFTMGIGILYQLGSNFTESTLSTNQRFTIHPSQNLQGKSMNHPNLQLNYHQPHYNTILKVIMTLLGRSILRGILQNN